MFRPRKRNWPIRVYKYWARPMGELPEQYWHVARKMQALWNALVDGREAVQGATTGLDGEEKKARWAAWNLQVRQIIAESDLNWECQAEILDRFNVASRKARKEHGTLRRQERLDKVMIPHRYTQGGLPIAQLMREDSRARRCLIRPVDKAVYADNCRMIRARRLTSGKFGIDDNVGFPFQLYLHRPLPNGAYVKKIMWSGKFSRAQLEQYRWSYSLLIVVEEPPRPLHRADQKAVGVDLGWRVMAEGQYLRIGMLADSDGQICELRLPFNTTKSKDRERPGWYGDFFGLIRLSEEIGDAVEDGKGALRALLPALPPGFIQMRQGGLRKLLRDIDTLGIENRRQHAQILGVLQGWQERETRLQHIRQRLYDRLCGRRRWLYGNLAAWLTRTYRSIVWEGDLSLKSMAEDHDNPALVHAGKYRQWASLHELRAFVTSTAETNGTEILGMPAAFTSLTCSQCGAVATEGSRALVVECENGHREDQDVRAARNLLLLQDTAQENGLRKITQATAARSLEIPRELQAVVVPCSAT